MVRLFTLFGEAMSRFGEAISSLFHKDDDITEKYRNTASMSNIDAMHHDWNEFVKDFNTAFKGVDK